MKTIAKHVPRNEHARALHAHANNANVAIRVDCRPKIVQPKKGKGSYRRIQNQQRDGAVSTGPAITFKRPDQSS
jgi:stalled ribosome alternative rescue factor ArfA